MRKSKAKKDAAMKAASHATVAGAAPAMTHNSSAASGEAVIINPPSSASSSSAISSVPPMNLTGRQLVEWHASRRVMPTWEDASNYKNYSYKEGCEPPAAEKAKKPPVIREKTPAELEKDRMDAMIDAMPHDERLLLVTISYCH
jgi:hypothetical protein